MKYNELRWTRGNYRGMLVEYLQYELLDSLFENSAAAALSFTL